MNKRTNYKYKQHDHQGEKELREVLKREQKMDRDMWKSKKVAQRQCTQKRIITTTRRMASRDEYGRANTEGSLGHMHRDRAE